MVVTLRGGRVTVRLEPVGVRVPIATGWIGLWLAAVAAVI
jgi:hypothetical protein